MNAPDPIMTEAPATPLARISERPDWGYLLREIHEMYRRSGAGGSSKIRSHQRAVREALNKLIEANPSVQDRPIEDKPVSIHLKRALDNGRREVTESVCRAAESVLPELSWLYGYEKVPRGLSKKYAYAEIAGPDGPVVSNGLITGLVLFGPKCTYPAHSHEGLTESYFVLSGTVSENDDGVWAPGSMIFNPPGRMHRITVSDREPALLIYCWHGSMEKLRHQKMVFTRKRKTG